MGTLKFTLCLLSLVFGISFCTTKKISNEHNVKQPVLFHLRMTDSPGPYSAVYIDLQGVEIGSNGNLIPLNVRSGIYNLVNFVNGLDTLIAFGLLNLNKIEEIKLILGPNNAVVANGFIHALTISNPEVLRIRINQELKTEETNNVLLDFNIDKSVVRSGNNVYHLVPGIKSI